eukprot:gene7606-11929_t
MDPYRSKYAHMAPFKNLGQNKKNDSLLLGRNPEDWQELFTQEGRPYYHNKVTKITQWEKPEELQVNNETNSLQNKIQSYEQQYSSRRYDEVPPERKGTISASRDRSMSYERRSYSQEKRHEITQEEREEKFFNLLKDCKITSDMDWNRAYKYISQEKRYKIIDSVNEKKALFAKYINQKKQKEKELKKSRQKKVKDDFFELLSKTHSISTNSTYKKILPMIEDDRRFLAVEREIDRLEYFDDFIIDLYKREKRTIEEMKSTQKSSFRKLLESRARAGKITTKTVWSDIYDDFRGMPVYENLEKLDRLDVWLKFIRDFEIREDEIKMKEKHKKKKKEQKHRSIFWNYLKKLNLTRHSKYIDIIQKIDKLEIYIDVIEQSGPLPKDIFDDYIHELQLEYKDDILFLNNLLNEARINLDVLSFNSYDEFYNFLRLKLKDMISKLNENNLKDFYISEIENKSLRDDKKKKQYYQKFKKLLKNIPEIQSNSTYFDCRHLIVNSLEFESIQTEDEKKKIFDEYVEKLKKKEEKKRKREEESIDLEELQRRKRQILEELNK